MATFHLELKPIQRSAKQSSVATSAYMSGQRLTDARENKTFDYTRKERVIDGIVVNPQGEQLDRESFWNAVEAKHRRGDAVVARSFEIDIPKELSDKSRKDSIELAYAFGREVAKHYGVGCEIDIHQGKNGLLHFHGMMSACAVLPDGTLGNKVVELDPIACKRAETETAAEVLRPFWQDLCNEHLQQHQINERIDHRSYEARGMDVIPQIKEGWGPDAVARHEVNVQIGITNKANQIARETAHTLEAQRKAVEKPARAKPQPVIEQPAPAPITVEHTRQAAPTQHVEPPKKPQTMGEHYAEVLATGRQWLDKIKSTGDLEAVKDFNKALPKVLQEAIANFKPVAEREYAEMAKAAQAELARITKETAKRDAYESRVRQADPIRYTSPQESDPRERFNDKRTIFNAKKWDALCQQWDDYHEREAFDKPLNEARNKTEEALRLATGKNNIADNAKTRAYSMLKSLGYQTIETEGKALERVLQSEYNKSHGIAPPDRGKGHGIAD